MANTLKIKRSATEGKRPVTTDLQLGELAVNTYDGKLFLKRSNGISEYIVEVAGNVGYEVKNQTGSTITKGTVVAFAGTLGASGKLLITPYIANNTVASQYIMGVVEHDIPNGSEGFVVDHGKIYDLNTSAWAQGTVLYASSTVAGGLVSTMPQAPNNKITVAAVVHSSVTAGILEVRVTIGSQLGNDELVQLSSLTNGDTLAYNSTAGRFENTQLKTINNTSILGSGNINVGSGGTLTFIGDASGSGTSAADITLTLANSGVTAGTYTKVTVDIKGRVTTGASLVSSDITTALGYTPVNIAGDTLTGKLNFPAATATTAGLNIGNGTAPSSPIAGDLWGTSTDLVFRAGSNTLNVAFKNAANTFQGTNTYNGASSFIGTATFSGQLSANQVLNLPGSTTSTSVFGTAATTGTTTIGGTSQTGSITIGQSTVSQTLNLHSGATASGSTKTINLGTGGVSGSTTTITIGSTDGTSITANGSWTFASAINVAAIPNLDASKITSGTIDAARLPSYVDDVLEYTNFASFPATGETGKIYVALDTNKTYRWSGTTYVYITSGAVDSVAGKTGVVTLTNSDVGLGNVENKSSATIRSELTSTNVTTALGYTPLSLAGGTMTGTITFNAAQTWPTFNQSTTGNAATSTSSTQVVTTNWTFSQDIDNSLVFKYNGVAKARLTTGGTFLAINVDSDPTP